MHKLICKWILLLLALASFPLSASPIKSDEYIQLMLEKLLD
jgi:hypothetical protein